MTCSLGFATLHLHYEISLSFQRYDNILYIETLSRPVISVISSPTVYYSRHDAAAAEGQLHGADPRRQVIFQPLEV